MLRGGFLRGITRAVDLAAGPLGDIGEAQQSPSVGRRMVVPIHRPPGAVNESVFLAGCTRCGDCMKACPVGAIVPAPERFRGAGGTPIVDVHVQACVMCEEAPCISACGPGVLRPGLPRKMGVAWIQPDACLARTGTFCTVCAERCPVPGAVSVCDGKPIINPTACTGCGVCYGVCPAPTNAIVVMPLADRPTPVAGGGVSGPIGRAAEGASTPNLRTSSDQTLPTGVQREPPLG